MNIQNVRNGGQTRRRSLETGNGIPVLVLLLVRFPRCSTREKKLLRNLRIDGDARVSFITLRARPDRDEKLRVPSPPPPPPPYEHEMKTRPSRKPRFIR